MVYKYVYKILRKLFVSDPKTDKMRKKWMKLVSRIMRDINDIPEEFFHFNVSK